MINISNPARDRLLHLLDKDKKILAKRISYKQISEIIKRLEK